MMFKISAWARANVFRARLLIVIGYILLLITAIAAGSLLLSLEIDLNRTMLLIPAGAFFLLSLLFPFERQKAIWGKRKYFLRQKKFLFVINLCLFAMATFLGNHPESSFRNLPIPGVGLNAASLPGDSVRTGYYTGKQFASILRDKNNKLLKWKERKLLLRKQVRAIRHDPDMSSGSKTALIVLCVFLAVGLAYGVGALACGLACNDHTALAILVALGGSFLIVWGCIKVIRSILKPKPKET